MRAPRAAATLLLALGLALISGCGCSRRVTLMHGGDSTAIAMGDSVVVLAGEAQSLWESGDGADASRVSATLLLADLTRRPIQQWEARTRVLLDSLAIGAEIAAAPCVVAVNFFARSNPDEESWPYLISCAESHPQVQEIEGRGLHLVSAALAPVPGGGGFRIPYAPGKSPAGGSLPSALALLFTHRAGGGQQPLVMVWSHAKREDPWNLLQTLGADSLGGVGTGEFEPRDSLTLVTRTYQASRGFDECASCPHLFRTRRFRWRGSEFVRIDDQRVPSPYGTFVMFITALSLDDRDGASHYVTDQQLVDRANKLDWGKPRGAWRVAPETDETAAHMVFFRGRDEAYRVEFAVQNHDWKITAFEPTTRSIE